MASTPARGVATAGEHSLSFERGGRIGGLILALLLGVGFSLLFWLPNHVPVAPIFSESYVFGFSNRAAEMVLAILLPTAFLLAKLFGLRLPASSSAPAARHLDSRLIGSSVLLTVVFGCFLYWFTRSTGGVLDGTYFLDRIHLMERGKVPYRDFEFVYGSFPLHASIGLARLLHVADIDGYSILFILENALGVLMLGCALLLCDIPSGGRRGVFLLFCGFGLFMMPGMSMNYTILRYSLPFFCLTAVTRLDRSTGIGGRAAVVAGTTVSFILLMGLSPEEGLAYGASVVFFLPLRRIALGRRFLPETLGLIVLCGGIFRYAEGLGLFTTMKTFGAGAFNLPIYPDPQVLLLFGSLLALGSLLASGRLREHLPANTALVAIYGVAMLPGALGRCDPGHIAGYELSLLAVALLFVWRWVRMWRTAIVGSWGTFVALPFLFSLVLPPPLYSKILLSHLYANGRPRGPISILIDRYAAGKAVRQLGAEEGAYKMQAMRLAASPGTDFDPHHLFPGSSPVLFAPMVYRPNKFSMYQADWIDEGYYLGEANITSGSAIERKIGELRSHPERDLLVSREGLGECGVYATGRTTLRETILYPFVPPVRNTVDIFVPLCTFIQSEYHWVREPSAATFGYGLMRHN